MGPLGPGAVWALVSSHWALVCPPSLWAPLGPLWAPPGPFWAPLPPPEASVPDPRLTVYNLRPRPCHMLMYQDIIMHIRTIYLHKYIRALTSLATSRVSSRPPGCSSCRGCGVFGQRSAAPDGQAGRPHCVPTLQQMLLLPSSTLSVLQLAGANILALLYICSMCASMSTLLLFSG